MGSFRNIASIVKFFLDPKVPFVKKLPVIGWIIYLLSPVDFLPDPVLGLGIVDDFILMLFIISIMGKRIEEYWGEKAGSPRMDGHKVIDRVEYKVEEDEKD